MVGQCLNTDEALADVSSMCPTFGVQESAEEAASASSALVARLESDLYSAVSSAAAAAASAPHSAAQAGSPGTQGGGGAGGGVADQTLLAAVTSQRDRFRSKAEGLEVELGAARQAKQARTRKPLQGIQLRLRFISFLSVLSTCICQCPPALVQAAEELAQRAVKDRDELYGKVRFLEAFAAGSVRHPIPERLPRSQSLSEASDKTGRAWGVHSWELVSSIGLGLTLSIPRPRILSVHPCLTQIGAQGASGGNGGASGAKPDSARISCGPLLFAVEDEAAPQGEGPESGALGGQGHARRRRARVTCFGGDQGAGARRNGVLPAEGPAEGRARRAYEVRRHVLRLLLLCCAQATASRPACGC